MCETNAYIYDEGREELFLDNVDTVRPEGGGLVLRNLFGEEKRLKGRIREISLMKHRIVLEKE
ncbi:MAG: CooT family nickel-binding protein [Thermodesulfovibrionales bacterium]